MYLIKYVKTTLVCLVKLKLTCRVACKVLLPTVQEVTVVRDDVIDVRVKVADSEHRRPRRLVLLDADDVIQWEVRDDGYGVDTYNKRI